ncbi:MAG: hypothetical protein IT305_08275 [Chloroflexi bacterium]|nr:hypothetical protein [Chloroflexota bacterium]
MRHRLTPLALSVVLLLAAVAWSPIQRDRQAEAANLVQSDGGADIASVHAAPAVPSSSTARDVSATPLPDYVFYPPANTSTGQPIQLLVVLHGMGGNGNDMAALFQSVARQNGWALLAPTMPYHDYMDPEQVRQDGSLLPRLKALIDVLPDRTGLTFEPRALFFGFSRGSQESIRFSLMFPDATLGVAGLSAGSYTLPATTYQDGQSGALRALRYPFGTADVDTICGRAFNPAAVQRVAYWIGVGATDARAEDVPRQWDQYVGTTRLERAKRYVDILQKFGARATLTVFPNTDHEVNDAIRADAVRFLASLSAASPVAASAN